VGNLRLILEMFKFLTCKEVTRAWRVNERFYESYFQAEKILKGHFDEVSSVAVFHNKEFLASASNDNTIRVRSLAAGKLTQILKDHEGAVLCVSRGDEFLLAESSDKTPKA